MRIQYDGGQFQIWFSERNLKALLAKLQQEGSFRTIVMYDQIDLVMTAESDEEHYKGREPGEMHPDTEGLMLDL